MREILFRGKRVDNGEWEESPYPYGTMSSGVVQHDFISQTVGQYTGRTDQSGVKIFEGDIIKRERIDGHCYEYEVFWWSNCNCWGLRNRVSQLLMLPMFGLYVVGNIHDNPELVEERNERNDYNA